MEIERKFLVAAVPENLEKSESKDIVQAYLCYKPVIRVRKENLDYYMTYKGEGFISREEHNLKLDADSFNLLLAKCEGKIIEKTRYLIELGEGSLIAELDIFKGSLSGLIMVEVEFPSLEAAKSFTPPSWFGEELSYDIRYTNAYLSGGMDAV